MSYNWDLLRLFVQEKEVRKSNKKKCYSKSSNIPEGCCNGKERSFYF